MNLELKYVRDEDGTRHLTIPDDRRAAVIAFVQERAAKTPADIEAVVQEGHDQLHAALAGLSEGQAAFKPSAEDWCVLELMAHVVSTKRIVAILAAALAEGKLPPGFTPELEVESAQDGVTIVKFDSLAAACGAADAAHADTLKFIRGIDGSTNLELRFRHFVFGALNAREWAVFQRIHDADHTPQIYAIKASAGFPAA